MPPVRPVPAVMLVTVPPVAGADDTHAEPVDVSTLPTVPDAVRPVPPWAAETGAVKPIADCAAAVVAAVKTAMPIDVPPRFTRAPDAVVDPVPPWLMATGIDMVDVSASTTFVPSQNIMARELLASVTPVPAAVLIVMV